MSLLKKGCISEVKNKPKVIKSLTIAYGKKQERMVLDCSHINPHLFKFRFKYDANTARELFKDQDQD